MRKAKLFLYNAAAVAGVGLVLRFSSMAYNVYISGRLGAEGMGLLTLITSVYALAASFATSGISLTCTRLIAEALAGNEPSEARRALRCCALFSLGFGLTAAVGLYALSGVLGRAVLHEDRAVNCLRALCPALPACALTSCFGGYFSAVRKAYKASVVSACEQGLRILFTVGAFVIFAPDGREAEAVLISSCAAEVTGFLILYVTLTVDRRRTLKGRGTPREGLAGRVLSISMPIAAASWVRSALVTAEHVLIPRGLRRHGDPSALGTYGIMHGMALPVVFFPYAILTPFTQLLIPEISRFKAQSDGKGISFTSSLTLRLTLLFAFGCSAYLCAFGEELGQALYHTDGVGKMVTLFALLIPVMYLDTSVDAILKGLGEQFYCMCVNIGDALISLISVLLLVPRFGAIGYLYTVFLSECFNTFFSFLRLRKRAELRITPIRSLLLPAVCASASAAAAKYLPGRVIASALSPVSRLWICAPLFLLLYYLLLTLCGALRREDRRYFAGLWKKDKGERAKRMTRARRRG